jgi:hypothetical protein
VHLRAIERRSFPLRRGYGGRESSDPLKSVYEMDSMRILQFVQDDSEEIMPGNDSVEFALGSGLFCAYAAGRDVRAVVIFAAYGCAIDAAKDVDLTDVRQ